MQPPHVTPKKHFGQNFLVDSWCVEKIISAMEVGLEDCLLEIGPGLGALTLPLIDRFGENLKLAMVEVDPELVIFLKRKILDGKSFRILQKDFLKVTVGDLSVLFNLSKEKFRVFGNLPYNISSQILFKLLELRSLVVDQHLMLQKEVVDRIVAKTSTSQYGRLSVMLQAFYSVEKLLDFGPESFEPKPQVRSSLLRMVPQYSRSQKLKDFDTFSRIVSASFSMRRKMVRNSLSKYLVGEDFERADLISSVRPQDISPEKYITLSNIVFQKQIS
ncbi:MAG: hypothetical protein CBC42_04315 [Betaproteobacteria bacterium TMED82]|nr:MAG: hypothetical protein CBC42_04315 [Betaproteobacteria bacterium TMED82]